MLVGYPDQVYDSVMQNVIFNDYFMYRDEGPVEETIMFNEDETAVLTYDELDIITSPGHSGSPI